MRWTAAEGAGFTTPSAEPWLPIGDAAACNVEDQRRDPSSVLHLCRDLVALRKARADLSTGSYRSFETDEGVWAWRRGETTNVAVNLSDRPAVVDLGEGTVAIGTLRARDGEAVKGPVELGPWEALVMVAGYGARR